MPTNDSNLFGQLSSDELPSLTNDEQMLIDTYVKIGRTLDDLPYTGDFEKLLARLRAQGMPNPDRRSVILTLQRLRKARKGGLPSVGRIASPPPKITSDDEAQLIQLVINEVGSLGSRDQLLYSSAFDSLVETFNSSTGKTLSPHDAWRIVAKLAK